MPKTGFGMADLRELAVAVIGASAAAGADTTTTPKQIPPFSSRLEPLCLVLQIPPYSAGDSNVNLAIRSEKTGGETARCRFPASPTNQPTNRQEQNYPRATSLSTVPSGAMSCTCNGIWPAACVEQLRHGS